jgi:hypothetical protein
LNSRFLEFGCLRVVFLFGAKSFHFITKIFVSIVFLIYILVAYLFTVDNVRSLYFSVVSYDKTLNSAKEFVV